VVPDLAFGYHVNKVERHFASKTVGISPMNYKGPIGWPDADGKIYNRYITSMVNLVSSLIDSGRRVTLFPSVRGDRRVIDNIMEIVEPHIREKILYPDVSTVEELIDVLTNLELTIASRLHGVLLSQLANTPVIALSYERKVDGLMREFGNESYCFPIESFSVSEVKDAVDSLSQDISNIRSLNEKRVSAFSESVCRQFEIINQSLSGLAKSKI
jgi:polysaccharide pyruvyl transferase WcaK-like protein